MLDRHTPASRPRLTVCPPRVDPEATAARRRIREYYLDEILAWQTGERGQDAPPRERERRVAGLYRELYILHAGAAGEEVDVEPADMSAFEP